MNQPTHICEHCRKPFEVMAPLSTCPLCGRTCNGKLLFPSKSIAEWCREMLAEVNS